MTTSVVPALIDALIAHAALRTGMSTVLVQDGDFGNPNDPGYRFMVGASGPQSLSAAAVAQADQVWPLATATGRDETGSIACGIYGSLGVVVPKEVRDEVFRIAGEVQTMLRTDILQSVPGLRWTSYTGQTVEQLIDENGTHILLTFKVEFKARI
jgi:hypothetical protein